MDNVIAEYQRWKAQGESLRAQAKSAMESRFRDLLTEAARISQEYHRDFGAVLKPPAQITAFRFKATGIKAVAKKAKGPVAVPIAAPVAPADPRMKALDKKLAQARAKLEAAKSAGKATKNLEDRIYEIEDEIRLASSAG
jgi:hypothetical protein